MTHEVVGNHVHEQLAHDHVRAFAAERMHVQARLDVIKAELDLPALLTLGGDLRSAVGAGVRSVVMN